MIVGFVIAVLIGIVWINVVSYLTWRSKTIYLFLQKNGRIKENFEAGYKRYLILLFFMTCVYLVICDLLILGFNDVEFIFVIILNVGLLMLMLFYHSYAIVYWLLQRIRPMGFELSKNLTHKTLMPFNQKTLRLGSLWSVPISMICGFVYIGINMIQ